MPELDPLIERVIFRCLERDAAKRPATTLQVAAALPGGDPLAAALAAGETPSPEMVAAAPKQGGLRPAVAISLLASAVVLLIATCLLSQKTALYQQVPLNKSPEVLRDRATELVKKFGYTAPAVDSTYGMALDRGSFAIVHAAVFSVIAGYHFAPGTRCRRCVVVDYGGRAEPHARNRGRYSLRVYFSVTANLGVVSLWLAGLISTIFFVHLAIFFPITSDISAWYAADFVLAAIVGLELVGFGFYTSLAASRFSAVRC